MRVRPFYFVVLATLLAAFLRFFHLATLAPEAWFDEVWFALRARELVANPQFVVFYRTPWGGGNALMVYLTAAAQLLGFTGISSSRIASAALGVIAVPLAYACFDEMLRGGASQSGSAFQGGSGFPSGSGFQPRSRRWIAALAALTLSYLLYWVIVSRVGTEPSLAPAAALFCVWQLKRAKRKLTTDSTSSVLPHRGAPRDGAAAPFRRARQPSKRSGERVEGYDSDARPAPFDYVRRSARGTPLRPRPELAEGALPDEELPTKNSFARSANSAASFLLVGVVAGVAQYNGPHARFILPLLGLIALHDLFLLPASQRRQHLLGLGLAALAGLIVVAPLALFFIREPEWLLARARVTTSVSFSNPKVMLENLGFTLIAFNFVGSFDPLTNYPGLPMFDVVQSIGFFVGHGWAVWNLRRSPAARELLAWEIIMMLPSLLTGDAPNFQRMIGFAAPAAAIIAIGWILALKLATGPRFRRLGFWALGFGICLSLLYQSSTLLLRYPKLSILPASYLAAPVNTARELIKRAEAGERVFVSRNPEDDDVIAFEFLFPGAPVQRLDFRQCLPLADTRPTRTSYLVLTRRDKQSVVNLYNAYPSATISHDYFWQDSGTLVEIPPGAPGPRPPNPGHASFNPGLTFLGYEWSGETIQAGQSLFITLYWKVETDIGIDYTSFVHVGTGLDGTAVVAQRDGQPCQGLFTTSQWRAGDLIRDSFAITLPPDAPPGDYPLAIGWYTYPDFTRLTLRDADAGRALPDNRAIIATITVTR